MTSPISAREAVDLGVPAGLELPAYLRTKVARSLNAPVEDLVARGVIASGEMLASVLPQMTSPIRAAGLRDEPLRRLYAAIYSAFRRRRSLLLLSFAQQVKLTDLAWLAPIESMRVESDETQAAARQMLERVALLHVTAFPQTILPNKLVKELRALAVVAKVGVPFVDELAADIFQGGLTETFLRAAHLAARSLEGSLYARYYGVPYDRVSSIDDLVDAHGVVDSPGLVALCEELAAASAGVRWTVARNGTILEQEQIVTTHNLAAIVDGLGLREALRPRLTDLARTCFRWICRVLRQRRSYWKSELRAIKDSAYAWRQMLFFLAYAPGDEVDAFLAWARAELQLWGPALDQRLAPLLDGLEAAARSERVSSTPIAGPARFLGWTCGRHWLATGGAARDVRPVSA